MTKYTLPFAGSISHKPTFPERTARKSGKGLGFEVTFQVWSNRKSMARSIRMQQGREHRQDDWHPVVALTDTEGY